MVLMWGWHALVWIGQRCRQRWRWWWYRRRIAQLQDHVQRALQAGAIEEAVGMLEEQQGLYDWPFQVEELLFKRSRRPAEEPEIEPEIPEEDLAPEEQQRRMRREIERSIANDPAALAKMLEAWLLEQKA